MSVRAWTWIAVAFVAACVGVLLADYAVATWRAPRDDKLIKNLHTNITPTGKEFLCYCSAFIFFSNRIDKNVCVEEHPIAH